MLWLDLMHPISKHPCLFPWAFEFVSRCSSCEIPQSVLPCLHFCLLLHQVLGNFWLHRFVCCICEHRERTRGVCPFNPNCAKRGLFCKHAQKCFVCDAWSCEECRLVNGDGEDVAAMVETIQPYSIFLDFDRTVSF